LFISDRELNLLIFLKSLGLCDTQLIRYNFYLNYYRRRDQEELSRKKTTTEKIEPIRLEQTQTLKRMFYRGSRILRNGIVERNSKFRPGSVRNFKENIEFTGLRVNEHLQ